MAAVGLLCATVLLIAAAWDSLQRRRVYCVVYAGLGFYGLSFLASYPQLVNGHQWATERAAWIYLVGTLILIPSVILSESLLHNYRRKRSDEAWREIFRSYSQLHLKYAATFLIVSLFFFLVFQADYGANWEENRSDVNLLLVLAPFFLFLGCPAVVTAWYTDKRVFLLLLVLILVVFSFSGSRAAILTALATFLWRWIVENRANRLNLRLGSVLVTFVICAFAIHSFSRGIRSFSPQELFTNILEANFDYLFDSIAIASEDLWKGGSESTIAEYLVVSANSANDAVYGFMTTIQRLLTMFIPGSLFPGKPVDVSYLLWEDALNQGVFDDSPYFRTLYAQYQEGTLGSLHPTLFGELFLSGEWISLVLSLVCIGLVCVLIDVSIVSLRPLQAYLMLGPTLVGMSMVARGNTVIGIGYFIYLLPVVLVVTSLANIFRNMRLGST